MRLANNLQELNCIGVRNSHMLIHLVEDNLAQLGLDFVGYAQDSRKFERLHGFEQRRDCNDANRNDKQDLALLYQLADCLQVEKLVQVVKLLWDVPPLRTQLLQGCRIWISQTQLRLQLFEYLDLLQHKFQVDFAWGFWLQFAARTSARILQRCAGSFVFLVSALSAITTLWLLAIDCHSDHFSYFIVNKCFPFYSLWDLQFWSEHRAGFALGFSEQVLQCIAYHLDERPKSWLCRVCDVASLVDW